jgi:flagellar biosynthetic protein FliR
VSSLLTLYSEQLLVFTLVLSRFSGLMMTAPLLSGNFAPLRVRAFIAVGLSLLVTPLYWGVPIESPGSLLRLMVFIGGEVIIGMALGLGIQILFGGIQIAGQIVGQMSGMHLADVFDPSFQSNVPMFSRLFNMLALAVFVLVGGHRILIDSLLDTFQWMPPGHAWVNEGIVETLTGVLAQSFVLGIRAAAPAMVALLMAVLVMGLISRTLPQLNIIAVGFSLNTMIMLATLAVTLGTMVWVFQDQVEPTIETVKEVLYSYGSQ